MTGACTVLEVRGVSAGYGSGNVISGVSLTVGAGEIVALIGANGAGKSTLLKTVSGLIPLTAGGVTYLGREVGGLTAAARVAAGIVQVPEGRLIFSGMTVSQNLVLGGYVRQGDANFTDRLERVLQVFPDLKGRLKHLAGNLSGGQQQMLAIGRGLMAGPSLMMLDEPSLGLAPKLVAEIFELISRLKHQGISILLSEQNARLSLAIADRGYVLENGRIALEGQGSALLHSKDVAGKYLGIGSEAGVASAQGEKDLALRLRTLL
jgi:branched-chain amino acid transport system ATP-binding protein